MTDEGTVDTEDAVKALNALAAALAAAQAAGTSPTLLQIANTSRAQGFAAGIEAAAKTAESVVSHPLLGAPAHRAVLDWQVQAIRALRPPAAPAESEPVQDQYGIWHPNPNIRKPPLSASATAGAKDRIEQKTQFRADVAHVIEGWSKDHATMTLDDVNLYTLHEKMTGHLFPAYSSSDERFLALALCGEAGELANMIKKRWRDGADLSEEIRDEIADVRVYLELLAKCFGIEGDKLDERVKEKLLKVVEKHKIRLSPPNYNSEAPNMGRS